MLSDEIVELAGLIMETSKDYMGFCRRCRDKDEEPYYDYNEFLAIVLFDAGYRRVKK